ncbi:hypothetical protein ACLOJK_005973 [Asimina triloba]
MRYFMEFKTVVVEDSPQKTFKSARGKGSVEEAPIIGRVGAGIGERQPGCEQIAAGDPLLSPIELITRHGYLIQYDQVLRGVTADGAKVGGAKVNDFAWLREVSRTFSMGSSSSRTRARDLLDAEGRERSHHDRMMDQSDFVIKTRDLEGSLLTWTASC